MLFRKRIKSHHFEKILFVLLLLFGLSALYIFIQGLKNKTLTAEGVILMELNLITIVILLALALLNIKIYEKVE